MDPRLLSYYNTELQHLRESGGEFAAEFPKIAGRLALDGFECADPYVERLLEGFSYLAARIQLKLDAEFPAFTQHLLEMVYPHYLAPTPSMTVVHFQPDLTEGSLAEGVVVPRDTTLRSQLGKGDQTPCEFRTAHDTTLWPLQLTRAEYFSRDVPTIDIPDLPGVRAGLHLRLRTTAGLKFNELALQRLPLFLRGSDQTPMRIYEQLMANAVAVVVRPAESSPPWQEVLDGKTLRRMGFEDHQAMLPVDPRSFSGYRLLHEYFTMPARFMFVELTGLQSAVQRCEGNELDVIVLFDQSDPELEQSIDPSDFELFCAPAINLFPKAADRIHLDDRSVEHHVVPDRSRPMDFEVCQITEAEGYGTKADQTQTFRPFYAVRDSMGGIENVPYYVVHRRPRAMSDRQRQHGTRSSYLGTEVFLTLVDAQAAPYSPNLNQLGLRTLCTNRDLPLHMPVGQGKTDFTLQVSLPVKSVRCLAGPTPPKPSYVCKDGETIWRLVNHLTLNYLSLVDNERRGASGLRQLLKLYGEISDLATRKQMEGVRSIESKPVVRRSPQPGPIAFARGLSLTLTLDETAFEGTGAFLLGAVLDEFFAQYVSLNCFTETILRTVDRGEVMRWPARIGRRHIL